LLFTQLGILLLTRTIIVDSLLENPKDPESLRWVDGQVDQFQITVDEQRGLEALRPNLDFKS